MAAGTVVLQLARPSCSRAARRSLPGLASFMWPRSARRLDHTLPSSRHILLVSQIGIGSRTHLPYRSFCWHKLKVRATEGPDSIYVGSSKHVNRLARRQELTGALSHLCCAAKNVNLHLIRLIHRCMCGLPRETLVAYAEICRRIDDLTVTDVAW